MYVIIKRMLDFLGCAVALFFIWPFFLVIVLLIKLESKGPAFFKQKRIGRKKSHFYILKFRTMRTDTPMDVPTHLLENPNQYITKMGDLLRRTSLDEVPQIFNILKGEMSLIGPRPALWNQFDLIAARDRVNANNLVPGLTGWAQVNGRDELPIAVKAKYDGEYAEKISFLFDMKIFFMTIKRVLRADGVKEGAARDE